METKSTSTTPDELLDKAQAARQLRICVRTLESFIKARRLAVIRLGRAVRIEPSEIERLKKSLTVDAIS
jgi:excisionase family DNA binding protein